MISIGSFAFGQKCAEKDVPVAVKAKFASLYPGIKADKWEKEGGDYEVSFDKEKSEMTVSFTAAGNLIDTETMIKVADLPDAIEDYITKTYPGEKIKEASKTVDASGKVTYEAEIDEMELIFDADGKFVKSVKETEKG